MEREDSDLSADLTKSQSTQQRARRQRLMITTVLHGKEWQAPMSLPCSVTGWSYPGKMAYPQKLRQILQGLTAGGRQSTAFLVPEHQRFSGREVRDLQLQCSLID